MNRFLVAVIVTTMVAFNSVAFAAELGTPVDAEAGVVPATEVDAADTVVESTIDTEVDTVVDTEVDSTVATGEDTTVDAGITPDSILYTVDKLFEDLQLAFASSPEAEAELLLQFAQERLSEAKEMTEQEKAEFVETAINDYMSTLEMAQDAVLEVVTDENQTKEVQEELAEELEETTEVDDQIEENLGEEQQQELEEAAEQVIFTANVVKNIDAAVVAPLREQGFGFGQIAHVVALAENSGKTVEEIASLVKGDKNGIGNVAKELGIHPSQMKAKYLKTAEAVPEEEVASEDTSTDATEETSADTVEGTPIETTEDTIQLENVEDAALTAFALDTATIAAEEIKKIPDAKPEPIKKSDKKTNKPEIKKADTKASQEKKIEGAKIEETIKTEKTDMAEIPKKNELKKEENINSSNSQAKVSENEGSKGGNSSNSNKGTSSGNSGKSGGGKGKK